MFLTLAALAAGAVQAAEFEFVVIGDTRPRFESQDFRLFEGLIGKINALKPARVINLGDLIYGYGPAGDVAHWRQELDGTLPRAGVEAPPLPAGARAQRA